MRYIFFILIWNFLSSCDNSQKRQETYPLTGDIRQDLKNLISKGDHIADVMDGIRQTPRQVMLTTKFQEGIRNNYEWFVEYMKNVPEGEPMPFHNKLGMTKEEYEELMGYMNNIEVLSTGKENITVENTNNLIQFKSKGKLSGYDSLSIDLEKNVVKLGKYEMFFEDSINISDEKNGLRSKWKGYSWKFTEPQEGDINLNDLSNLSMKAYTFTVGRLEKNGKTYMSLKCREIESGVKTIDFELPVIF